MKTALILAFILLQAAGLCPAQPAPSPVLGSWQVEVSFSNGEHRSLHFEARAPGEGSLLAVVSAPAQAGSTEQALATWSHYGQNSITISGPVTFPLGNVGLKPGTLVLTGEYGADGTITGEAKFFPLTQDKVDVRPSKIGTFKAVRGIR